MSFITIPLVTGIVFLAIYKVFQLFVCRRERIMLLEKIENLSGKNINLSGLSLDAGSGFGGKFFSLRLGALLLGVGLGIFVGVLTCWAMFPSLRDTNDSITWGTPSILLGGCILLFGGLGLVIAFLVELRYKRKKDKE